MAHSCRVVDLDAHFAGRDPRIRRLFGAWLRFVKRFGPVTVIPQKTRISFQARVRFAGAVIRRDHVQCGFWLKRKVSHPLIDKVELIPPRDYVYRFRLKDAAQLAAPGLRELIEEAYQVGCQKYAP
ncbi:MAG: DUF5655 domain-containing protein [Phycisphaerae bacterium]|nr:DUF5655 domain-containing protein [Phycisphaerae bacterium]